MSSIQQWASSADAEPWTKVNASLLALAGAFTFAEREAAHSGLVVGIGGGPFNGATIADTTVTCTDNTTNYIVALRSTGAVSTSTATTNWNDATAYGRLARAVFAAGVLTYHDERWSSGGIFDRSGVVASAATELKGLRFTSDTDSTADSDPGNGLFKWNNATQASATKLFIDNQTADGASLATLWASIGQAGMLFIQQGDDADRWQLWRWTAVADDTGYRDFTVALQAKSAGDIQDAKTCYFDIAEDDTGSGGTVGKHAIYIAAGSISPSAAGGCAALATIASAANQPDIQTLDFDATTQEYAQFGIVMPKSWNEGTVTFRPHWSHAATTTNFGVVWSLQAVAVSDDDAIAAAFGTEQISTDTGGTTNDLYSGPESSAITVAGTPAAEDMVFFRVSRVTGNGGDTMAIDARLHGVTVYITTDAETDA